MYTTLLARVKPLRRQNVRFKGPLSRCSGSSRISRRGIAVANVRLCIAVSLDVSRCSDLFSVHAVVAGPSHDDRAASLELTDHTSDRLRVPVNVQLADETPKSIQHNGCSSPPHDSIATSAEAAALDWSQSSPHRWMSVSSVASPTRRPCRSRHRRSHRFQPYAKSRSSLEAAPDGGGDISDAGDGDVDPDGHDTDEEMSPDDSSWSSLSRASNACGDSQPNNPMEESSFGFATVEMPTTQQQQPPQQRSVEECRVQALPEDRIELNAGDNMKVDRTASSVTS
jgi:hypothetical protein